MTTAVGFEMIVIY